MTQNPFHSRPYFDWGLDRWKIGIALLLLLILLIWAIFRSEPVEDALVEEGDLSAQLEPSALTEGTVNSDSATSIQEGEAGNTDSKEAEGSTDIDPPSDQSSDAQVGEVAAEDTTSSENATVENGTAEDSASDAGGAAANNENAGSADVIDETEPTAEESRASPEAEAPSTINESNESGAGTLALDSLQSGDEILQGVVVWSGTATPLRRIQLVEQSANGQTRGVLGTVKADEAGAWRLVLFNPLELGEHHAVIREITDDNQVSNQTDPFTFTVIEP